jgi:hypothetical protein
MWLVRLNARRKSPAPSVPYSIEFYRLLASRLQEVNEAFSIVTVAYFFFGVVFVIIKPRPLSALEHDVWEIAPTT